MTLRNTHRQIAGAALPALLLFLALAPGARADTVTWNYTGNPFTDVGEYGDSNLLGDSLNASITFSGPLAPNLSDADLSADIVSWTIWDSYGIFDYTSGVSGVNLLGAYFSTDSNGNIVADYAHEYDSFAVQSLNALNDDPTVCVQNDCMSVGDWTTGFANPPVGNDSFHLIITSGATPLLNCPASNGDQYYADLINGGPECADSSSFHPGVWTEANTTTPEVGTLFTVATFLLGLAVVAGKRRLFR